VLTPSSELLSAPKQRAALDPQAAVTTAQRAQILRDLRAVPAGLLAAVETDKGQVFFGDVISIKPDAVVLRAASKRIANRIPLSRITHVFATSTAELHQWLCVLDGAGVLYRGASTVSTVSDIRRSRISVCFRAGKSGRYVTRDARVRDLAWVKFRSPQQP
jgi:hypothetical protein